MDWNQGRFGYYVDFVLVPLLVLAAFVVELLYNGPSRALFATAIVGVAVWEFLEYWIHRSLFHRFMRKQHWLHHIRPRGYVSAPALLTTPLHICIYAALVGALGMAAGTGLFLGLEAGYMAYIALHDRIHHGPRVNAWVAWRGALHDLHHGGKEVNFGVVTSFWDRAFRTYLEPVRTT